MQSVTAGLGAETRLSATRLFFTVLTPFGLGFFFSYLFRTTNAVISPQLVAEFALTPADLGFLTSVYFVMVASVQLPLGVFLDRFGPRRVQFVLLLIAALGGLAFASAGDFAMLSLARACIGIGFSASLMAALKASVMWWPKERLPLINNMVAAFGSFGAITATWPLEFALHIAGWREIIAVLAGLTAVLAVAILLIVPERDDATPPPGRILEQFAATGAIYRNPFFWRLGFMLFLCQSALLSYQTLWAAPWLRDIAGFDRIDVADHLLLLQTGMLVGVLVVGFATDRLRHLGVQPIMVLGISMAAFMAVQLVLAIGVVTYAAVTWTAFGFFGGASLLGYSIYSQYFPPEQTGRAVTAANLVILTTVFAMQWGIGAVVGLFAPVAPNRYPPEAHSTAFFMVLALECIGYVWFVWPRRKAAN